MSFETPRLIARPLREEDISSIVKCRAHPKVAQFQNWETYTTEQAHELVSEMLSKRPGEPGWYQWAIEENATQTFVGDCGLKIDPADQRLAQIGYTIRFERWNKGLATEIVKALVEYAFKHFSVHRISASVDPRNHGSCRVLEKSGFLREALFRKSEWFKGSWADDAIYAQLREDFESRANSMTG